MNKKGVFFSVFVFVITLIALISLAAILSAKHSEIEKSIGERQMEILRTAERAEETLHYVDMAASFSAERAIFKAAKKGGFKSESLCGHYRNFTSWNCEEYEKGGSFPTHSEVKESVKNYMEPELENYLVNYDVEILPNNNYFISISDEMIVEGHASTPFIIFSSEFYESIRANPEDDKIIYDWKNNEGGEILSQVATEYAVKYSSLPYMWGGMSPYPYSVTMEQKEKDNPVFQGVYIPEKIPSGTKRAGQPIQPGFDCSGFVWWNLRNMGIDVNRMNAHGYYHWAQNKGEMVCDSKNGKPCPKEIESLDSELKEGDLLFIDPCTSERTRDVCHVAIYTGNGKIAESLGGEGLELRNIPSNYLPGNNKEIVAAYRLDFSNLERYDEDSKPKKDSDKIVDEEIHYDPPSNKKETIYSIMPSFTIDTNYSLSVYDKLRRTSLDFISSVEECERGFNDVETCVDTVFEREIREKTKKEGIVWSRNCTNITTTYRHMFEDELRSCFDSAANNCYCNLTIPEDKMFEDFEYKFEIKKSPFAEEIVIPYSTEKKEMDELNKALRKDKFDEYRMEFQEIKKLYDNLRCVDVIPNRESLGYYIILFKSSVKDKPVYLLFSEKHSSSDILLASASVEDKKHYSYYEIFEEPGIEPKFNPIRPLFVKDTFSDIPLRGNNLNDKCLDGEDKCLEKSPMQAMIDSLKDCTRPSREDTLPFSYYDEGEDGGLIYEDPDKNYPVKTTYSGEGTMEEMKLRINNREREMDRNLFFVKTDERISFISKQDLMNFLEHRSKEDDSFFECSYEPKRKYKFCPETERKVPFIENEKIKFKYLIYNFALYFPP